jgi:hypothetical protein
MKHTWQLHLYNICWTGIFVIIGTYIGWWWMLLALYIVAALALIWNN